MRWGRRVTFGASGCSIEAQRWTMYVGRAWQLQGGEFDIVLRGLMASNGSDMVQKRGAFSHPHPTCRHVNEDGFTKYFSKRVGPTERHVFQIMARRWWSV